ncbi:antitermination protein, partial [Escherichia coli]
KKNNSDLHDLLVDYYVGGMTFMALARKHGRSDCWVGRMLQKAGNDSNLLIVLYVQIMPDDFVMQLHRF